MRRPPISALLPPLALALLFAGAKPILFDSLDPDCFWHLRVGEQLLRDGIGPLKDTLSFSSQTTPWTPYSWLADIAMFKLWAFGGYRAAILATSLLVVALFGLIALSCREAVGAALDDGPAEAVRGQTRTLAVVLATAFGVFITVPYLSFRPVTAVFVLLAANVWLLLRDRRRGERSRAVWAIIPVTALATNIHLFAGVTVAWCAAMWIGSACEWAALRDAVETSELRRSVRRYAWLTIGATIASLATPMLPGAISTAIHYGLLDPMVASDVIAEMRPFFTGTSGRVSLGLVIFLFVCVARHHRRLRAGEILCLLAGFALLLKLGRFAPLFALVAAPVVAVTMPKTSDAPLLRRPMRWAMGMIFLICAWRVALAFPSRGQDVEAWINRQGPDAGGYPVEAARYVDAAVPPSTGRIINEFNWGGYLEWKLGQKFKTLLDGRTQVFSRDFWGHTYLTDDATRLAYLKGVNADVAVVPIDGSVFRSSLVKLGWKIAHHDERADVLVPPAAQHLATTD